MKVDPRRYAPGEHDRMQGALATIFLVAGGALLADGWLNLDGWHSVVLAVVLCAAALGVYQGPEPVRPAGITRLEAEDLWGYIPEEWPPWRCPDCGQRNARWSLECGRCERPRTGDDHD